MPPIFKKPMRGGILILYHSGFTTNNATFFLIMFTEEENLTEMPAGGLCVTL